MKKVIIALLLMIPLLVILTISLSGKIISAEVAIGIENIELWHKGERVTQATINYGEYTEKKLRYQLKIKYFPGVALVTGFKWYSDNEEVAVVDDDGIVTFRECGFAKITAESLDASSVRASCSFFVEDDTIHKIRFYSYDTGKELSSLTLEKYATEQIRTEISPYNAMVDDPVFTSSDENVFTCSSNGLIFAKGEGTATLTVSAKNKSGGNKTVTLPVTVSGTALVKQEKVYAYGDGAFDLAPYMGAGSVVGGNEIDLSSVPYGETRSYAVSDGTRTGSVLVERLPYQRMLSLEGLDVMLRKEWKNGAYIAVGHGTMIRPIDKMTTLLAEGVTITSTDDNVIRAEGGVIKAYGAGTATLTFAKAGYESFSMEITAATPVSYFALNFDSDDDVVGLGSRRVFGTKSVYDGVIQDGVRVTPQNLYPADCDTTLFSYSVDEDWASVDETGRLTFRDDAVGKKVTVTVKSLFSTNAMSRTYTFENVVKGINVGFGFGANPYDGNKDELPSFVPYNDALNVMYEDRSYALVFQTNLYMPTKESLDAMTGEHNKLRLIRDIYGNGYKIDGQLYQYDYESHIFEDINDNSVEEGQTGITVTDLLINSYAPVGGDSQDTFDALMLKGGEPIRSFLKEKTDFRTTFRYCVFQYSYSHACLIGGTFEFDGCIFRNSAGVSLMIQSLHGQENYVTINNCIFSNSISMAGIVSNGTFPNEGEEVRYNSITWTGDNYIYNWKKTDEVKLDIIPKGLMKNEALDILLESVNNKLSECAQNSFLGGMNSGLIVKYDKEDYVNMGFLFINFWSPDHTIVNGTREKVTDGMTVTYDTARADFVQMELNTVALGAAIKKATKKLLDFDRPTYLMTNRTADGTYTTSPGETYKLNESTYAKVRGQRTK